MSNKARFFLNFKKYKQFHCIGMEELVSGIALAPPGMPVPPAARLTRSRRSESKEEGVQEARHDRRGDPAGEHHPRCTHGCRHDTVEICMHSSPSWLLYSN